MSVEQIIRKVEDGCNTDEEWIKLYNEVASCNLSDTDNKILIDSGVTEMLSMIYEGIMKKNKNNA